MPKIAIAIARIERTQRTNSKYKGTPYPKNLNDILSEQIDNLFSLISYPQQRQTFSIFKSSVS